MKEEDAYAALWCELRSMKAKLLPFTLDPRTVGRKIHKKKITMANKKYLFHGFGMICSALWVIKGAESKYDSG